MNIFKYLYETIYEALFPHSTVEKALFNLSNEEMGARLKPAPPYTGLAVPLPEATSVFAYKDELVEKLIWNIKYKKSARAIEMGAHALNTYLSALPGTINYLIVPMPITRRRRNERGYNQCELLTDEIKKLHEKSEAGSHFIFENNLLIRTHHDGRHTLKGRKDRVRDAKGIFGVNKKIITGDTHVIIIDDVITTGSTMREAIDTLKKAGFNHVSGLSLAH